MKILFLTIGLSDMSRPSGFYEDLIAEMVRHGLDVTVMSPMAPGTKEGLSQEGDFRVIRVKAGHFKGIKSILKKGLSMITLGYKYKKAIKKYLSNEHFDYVILPTPPASLVDVARYVKIHMGAKLYVILRDIHPECFKRDVIPSEIMDRTDVFEECKIPYKINPIIYKYMYWKSQRLYKEANMIGCMTPANIEFVSKIAPYVHNDKILLLPNWYSGNTNKSFDEQSLRKKYNLEGKFIAIFGGTIGPAQAIWNIASLARYYIDYEDIVFLVVGKGPKQQTLRDISEKDGLTNIRMMDFMPREDYEAILSLADVGLISIDEKYPVPTSPSKVIGYMALGKPVLAMFNEGNDYGDFYLDRAGCGLWSVAQDHKKMCDNLRILYENKELRINMGEAGYAYYKKHFDVKVVCKELCNQLQNG